MRIRDGLLPLLGILFMMSGIGTAATWVFGQFSADEPEQPYVGIQFTALEPIGVHIEDVLPGSPAEAAGLQPGDLVYTLDGMYVDGNALLARLDNQYSPADVVTLGVHRDGVEHHMVLHLAAESATREDRITSMSVETLHNGFRLTGVTYNPLASTWSVGKLEAGSVLHGIGLRENDVIIGVNGHHMDDRMRPQLITSVFVESSSRLIVRRDNTQVEIEVPSMVAQLMLMEAEPTSTPPKN